MPTGKMLPIDVTVTGFKLQGFVFEREDELDEIAEELASDIGMRLVQLGHTCDHGEVSITIEGNTGTTEPHKRKEQHGESQD